MSFGKNNQQDQNTASSNNQQGTLEQMPICDTYTSLDIRAYDSELVFVNDSNSEFFAPFLR